MPVTLYCQFCGRPYQVDPYRVGQSKFCSYRCSSRSRAKVAQIKRNCPTCGNSFTVKTSSKKKYCSHWCATTGRTREYTCEHCGKVFRDKPSRPRKYCSRECYGLAQRTRFTKECPICHTIFTVHPCSQHKIYCSRECAARGATGSKRKPYRTSEPASYYIKCSTRGDWFVVRPSGKNRKFCSRSCFYQSQTTSKPRRCAYCGAKFVARASFIENGGGLYCSYECHHLSMTYLDSETSRTALLPADWAELAESIRQRDGYKCTRCGKKAKRRGRALDVHHIIPVILSHDNSPSNLRTLCASCHRFLESNTLWLL